MQSRRDFSHVIEVLLLAIFKKTANRGRGDYRNVKAKQDGPFLQKLKRLDYFLYKHSCYELQ